MTPYYFSASIGDVVNVWAYSHDFATKVGFAHSGSTVQLGVGELNGWQYDSQYQGAATNCLITASAVYKVEVSSNLENETGSFQLYISAPQTSSVVANHISTPWRLVYSPNGNKIFSTEWIFDPSFNSNVTVIDPLTSTVVYSYTYSNTVMLDSVYCGDNDTVFVWVSSSAGEFLQEYSSDGSSLTSHSIYSGNPVWQENIAAKYGLMTYNTSSNQILLVPGFNGGVTPVSWSIYDCTSHTIVHSGSFPSHAICPIYVPSNDSYYVTAGPGNPLIKINASTYVLSTVSNLTGSVNVANGLAYIPEVDRFLYGNDVAGECVVIDPSTDSLVARIPGLFDFCDATYDPCQDCIVISDDSAGDITYADGGGLCYVTTGSYQPVNFVRLYGIYNIVRCDSTSTVFAHNYNDNEIFSVFTQKPTGSSFPQPPYL